MDFGELYEQYFAPIYRYVYFKVRHKETAEDITQTVFLKALAHIDNYRDLGAPFLSWLYTIARNLCIDFFKKKREVTLESFEEMLADLPDTHTSATSATEERELRETLALVLSSLTDEQRELVTLRFIEERSYAEIAQIMGKNEEALRAINYRAMKILRDKLKNYE